jgi:hypothetical protein
MADVTPPPPLVHTPYRPRAVVHAQGVTHPEACLNGGESVLIAGATPASLVLDFGEELVGVLDLFVTVETAATLELTYGEDLEEALLAKDPFPPDHWYHRPRDTHALQPGVQTVRHPGRRAFRYVNVVLPGPGRLRLRGAQMMLEHAPVTDLGWFTCSDPLLNEAWQISQRTIRLCLQGFYEDGIKRDGMLWIGDYRVEFLCAHALFGETALARRSLQMFAQCRHDDGSLSAAALQAGGHLHPRLSYMADLSKPGGLERWVLANYCADFIAAVWDYVLHTGDTALAVVLGPVVEGVLGFLEKVDLARASSPQTFITDNQPDLSDWWGSRSALAYQLAAAFGAAAKILDLLGETARAEYCRGLHRRRLLEAAAMFGDPARAACRDDVAPGSTRSWHAHAAAFLAGGLTRAELHAIYPLLEGDPAVRRPMAGFMEFYLLQAWLEAGLIREALGEMRSYYGHMLRNGATTTWEIVDRRVPGIDRMVAGGRSQCHGWSAGPAYLLPARILGITPATPGYREVDICPDLGDLAWAEGGIPTPHGIIRAELAGPGKGAVTLPPGVTGRLHRAGRAPVPLAGGQTHTFA